MRREACYPILLLVVLAGLFSWSVIRRQPWFGSLAGGPQQHQNVTAHALKYARIWYHEGPWSVRFGMVEHPASIEFDAFESRSPFFSFPPGLLVPIYLLSIASGNEPSLGLIMGFNLAIHAILAGVLSLLVWGLLRRLGVPPLPTLLFSVIPLVMEFLLPGPLYWHQNVYFSDQLSLLLIAVALLLEVHRPRRGLDAAQAACIFLALLTDWFSLFVACGLLVRRRIDREPIWTLGGATLGAIALYVAHLMILGITWEQLQSKILFRTGWGAGGEPYAQSFFVDFWSSHIAQGYGRGAIVLLWGCLGLFVAASIFAYRRRGSLPEGFSSLLAFFGLLLVPCFVHAYVFRNHSAVHSYTALKFSLSMALVPFIIAPLVLLKMTRADDRLVPASCLLLIMALAHVGVEQTYVTGLFVGPELSPRRATAVRDATRFEDVVFSPDFEIPAYPSYDLAYSLKRVYKIRTLEEAVCPPGGSIVVACTTDRWKTILEQGGFRLRSERDGVSFFVR